MAQASGGAGRGQMVSGWVGMVVFGGTVMIITGLFQGLAGLVGIFNDQYFLVGSEELVVSVSYTAWGWAHLVLGVVLLLTGFGILAGQTWARVTGVVLAGISSLVNIAFLAAHPVWSTLIIALDILVIYALVAHGREMADTR
ncbi:MAG: DUF7144 family membrane protein [Nocardioidaceae bacterium]